MDTQSSIVFSDQTKVIIELAPGKLFQFCKACETCAHLEVFIKYICPELHLTPLDLQELKKFESWFYHSLARQVESIVNYETGKLASYLVMRYGNDKRLTPKDKALLARIEKDFLVNDTYFLVVKYR